MGVGLICFLLVSSFSLCFPAETIDDAVDHIVRDIFAEITDDEPLPATALPAFSVTGISCESGSLSGLDTLYRTGHCSLDVINDTEIMVNLVLGFKNLTAHYPNCTQLSFLETDALIATFKNSFDAKIELNYDNKSSCYPAVESISVDPYSSFHSSSLQLSFGPGLLRRTEAFVVKTLLRIFKFLIEKLINNVALKQSSVINDVDICGLISE